MERLTQKSTAYKVPAAEAAGQKPQHFPPFLEECQPKMARVFFVKLKRKISLHDEQTHVITQRNDIFYMMKRQPDSRTVPDSRLVTLFQKGAPNSEKPRI